MSQEERYEIPESPGVPSAWPGFESWPQLVERNRAQALEWRFEVGGRSASEMRNLARAELLSTAKEWTARAGIEAREPGSPEAPIVMTGHQPELYHCGVWIKQFAMEKLAEKTGASAVDVVVDSDSFEDVGFWLPCRKTSEVRCRYVLATGGKDTCFACAGTPSSERIDALQAQASGDARRFGSLTGDRLDEFVVKLREAAAESGDLGEALTRARRAHEGPWGRYLEAPILRIAKGAAFDTFVADIAAQAHRFADIYNSELSAYRSRRKMRSKAQPFPDLQIAGERSELPLWLLGQGRNSVWAEPFGDGARLFADDVLVAEVSPEGGGLSEMLSAQGLALAPKALALTLFTRLFCCDLLIHGIGGAKYDAVTDQVCRRYYGVEAPRFAAITLTMQLPSDTAGRTAEVGPEMISALKARIHRLEHNPDQVLDELDLSDEQRRVGHELAAEKAELVRALSQPGVDKKPIGLRVREINASLAEVVQPLRRSVEAELAEMERMQAEAEVLSDREYPYFLWSPGEIAETLS